MWQKKVLFNFKQTQSFYVYGSCYYLNPHHEKRNSARIFSLSTADPHPRGEGWWACLSGRANTFSSSPDLSPRTWTCTLSWDGCTCFIVTLPCFVGVIQKSPETCQLRQICVCFWRSNDLLYLRVKVDLRSSISHCRSWM